MLIAAIHSHEKEALQALHARAVWHRAACMCLQHMPWTRPVVAARRDRKFVQRASAPAHTTLPACRRKPAFCARHYSSCTAAACVRASPLLTSRQAQAGAHGSPHWRGDAGRQCTMLADHALVCGRRHRHLLPGVPCSAFCAKQRNKLVCTMRLALGTPLPLHA